MIPLIGRVFNRPGGHDVETGRKRSVAQLDMSQAMEETATQAVYPFTWDHTTQQSASHVYPQAGHASSSSSTTLQSNVLQQPYWPIPSSNSNFDKNPHPLPAAQPAHEAFAVSEIPPSPRDPVNRLTIPSVGFPRSRSNSRSSRRPSRRNTPAPREVAAEGGLHQSLLQPEKVRLVGIADPSKDETIAAQTLRIQQLTDQASSLYRLSRNGQYASSLQDQINTLEQRAKKVEEKLLEAEQQADFARRNAADAEKEIGVTKKRLVQTEEALESEKVWADERVKMTERNAQQETENKLREAKQKFAMSQQMNERPYRSHSRPHSRGPSSSNMHGSGNRTDFAATKSLELQEAWAGVSKTEVQNSVPIEMEMSPDLDYEAEVDCEGNHTRQVFCSMPRKDKAKYRLDAGTTTQLQVPRPIEQADWGDQTRSLLEIKTFPSPGPDSDFVESRERQSANANPRDSPSNASQSSQRPSRSPSRHALRSELQVPRPMDFRKPRAGGKKLRLVPPPPRLHDNHSDSETETGLETFRQVDMTNLALHEKMDLVLDSNRKMAEMFEMLSAKESPQSAYRPRRKADPEFKSTPVRPPRNPQRTATLRFIRSHLYERLEITSAQDILKHKDYIYPSNTTLKCAMAAYEENRAGTGPELRPTMRINWDKFDGMWNSELCAQFVEYIVKEKEYANGQPTDEEQQIAINIFWEQLERLREIVKRNRPKNKESDEQANVRIAARRKAELAKASMNSRRKNTFHERVDTCLLHIQSQGIPDDEKKAWENHLSVIQELGVEGTSSDDPDDEDPRIFHVKALPWRARELTKICVQTDQARNTTNAFGNHRAGNLPRTRKRRKSDSSSSRKAPSEKPINFYNPEWYAQLGRDRQRKLKAKQAMEIQDTDFVF